MTRKAWAKQWLRFRNSAQRAYAGEGVHAQDEHKPALCAPRQRPPAYTERAMLGRCKARRVAQA